MNIFNHAARRLRLLFRKPTVEQELSDEVRIHLEMEADNLVRRGWHREDAEREARLLLGGLEPTKELVRDARGGRWLDDLGQDLGYAQRGLRKNPGFTLVAVLVLALGIGANTAVYSVVSHVLLEPLPFRDPDRLVAVWETNLPERPRTFVSPGAYLDWRDRNTVFDGLEAYAGTPSFFNTVVGGQPLRLQGRSVSVGLLSLLGVAPAVGRGFLPEESLRGAGQVVLVSDGLRQRLFGRDPDVLGRAIPLNGASYTIVGVLPPAFAFPSPDTELWIPLAFSAASRDTRTSHPFQVVGRLAPDVTLERARTEMSAIATQLQQELPAMRGWHVGLSPLLDAMVINVRAALLILAAAVGLVLFVACMNVANMLLVRATVRRPEMALRAALGASRRRVFQQLLTESLVLGAAAGVAGLGMAWLLVSALPAVLAASMPRVERLEIDGRAVWFTAVVTLATVLAFGVLPAWQGARRRLTAAMAAGARGVAGGRSQRLRAALVVTQVACAVVLLVGAGLLMRSFSRLLDVDPGFDPRNVLVGRVDLTGIRDAADQRAFFETLIERLRRGPGVTAVGASHVLPLHGDYGVPFYRDGQPRPEANQMPTGRYYAVTPGYFAAMGIPLVRGRLFTDGDAADAPGVLIVNEELARRHFPDEDPIGRYLQYTNGLGPLRRKQVVGIVRNTLHSGLDAAVSPQIYDPFAQSPFPSMAVALRAPGGLPGLPAALRREVQTLKADQPLSSVEWMDVTLGLSVERERFLTSLTTGFAGVALLLAALGLYGVLAYAVVQRSREMAVRLALGASPGAVVRLVVGDGARLCLSGLVIGLIVAAAVTRSMRSVLFEVSATDPLAFAIVPVVLAGACLLAIYLPARRVTRIEPLEALRVE